MASGSNAPEDGGRERCLTLVSHRGCCQPLLARQMTSQLENKGLGRHVDPEPLPEPLPQSLIGMRIGMPWLRRRNISTLARHDATHDVPSTPGRLAARRPPTPAALRARQPQTRNIPHEPTVSRAASVSVQDYKAAANMGVS